MGYQQRSCQLLRSLATGFDVVISSETMIAKFEKRDIYHAQETMHSLHLIAEHIQDGRDVGLLVRRVKDLATVFLGCNIQNPYAGVMVQKTIAGQDVEWNANMFVGKWCEPLATAAALQPQWYALDSDAVATTKWVD